MKKTLSIVLSLLFMGFLSPAFANSIKWSMPGDSLTLDPHAQNEGPTHMVSRQVYEGLVTPGINMEILPQLAESWDALVQILGYLTSEKVLSFMMDHL